MGSDLISYLVDEKVAELEQKLAAMLRTVQNGVEDAVILRFPNTPAVLVRHIRSLTDLNQLAALQRAVLRAPDQPAVEALLAALSTER